LLLCTCYFSTWFCLLDVILFHSGLASFFSLGDFLNCRLSGLSASFTRVKFYGTLTQILNSSTPFKIFLLSAGVVVTLINFLEMRLERAYIFHEPFLILIINQKMYSPLPKRKKLGNQNCLFSYMPLQSASFRDAYIVKMSPKLFCINLAAENFSNSREPNCLLTLPVCLNNCVKHRNLSWMPSYYNLCATYFNLKFHMAVNLYISYTTILKNTWKDIYLNIKNAINTHTVK